MEGTGEGRRDTVGPRDGASDGESVNCNGSISAMVLCDIPLSAVLHSWRCMSATSMAGVSCQFFASTRVKREERDSTVMAKREAAAIKIGSDRYLLLRPCHLHSLDKAFRDGLPGATVATAVFSLPSESAIEMDKGQRGPTICSFAGLSEKAASTSIKSFLLRSRDFFCFAAFLLKLYNLECAASFRLPGSKSMFS